MNQPLIGFGEVRHKRLKPVEHSFAYPTFFLLLPMRALHAMPKRGTALAHNRRGVISFHDSDHGDGGTNSLVWLDALLHQHNIDDADGEAWLHCYPRMLGYAFKPVSFWYCQRADGTLRAVVVEVNNTHGERHCYVLDEPVWGRELAAPKAFFVSPFCKIEGSYRFRFWLTEKREHTIVRIDHDDETGPLLQTSVSGTLEPATRASLWRAIWRHPLFTIAITARIHWQAVRLWMARVPIIRHLPQSR
ncbi:MAG: DUF1365 domain-containing protein [Ramlibacter sp.]|nr:DUF1365 domain-containing protein [Ramlibacter sp.]